MSRVSSFLASSAFVLGLACAVVATPAAAVTASCTVGTVTYSLSHVAANDANNVSCFSGGPDYSGTPPITETFFGMEYALAFKSDEAKGDGAVTFSDPITKGEAVLATWAINDPGSVAQAVIIGLKQSSSYAAFLISSLNGTWQINGPGMSVNDFSHVDIWYKPGDTTPIPLPAALPLFAGGLGGLGLLGWWRRRRRRQDATA